MPPVHPPDWGSGGRSLLGLDRAEARVEPSRHGVTFNVAASNGKTESYEGDYKITDGGVLAVKPGSGDPVIFSPSGSVALEVTDAPERPGDTRDLLSG